MSVSVTETEAKYEAGPDDVLPPLDTVPHVAATVSPPEQLLVATYYDTSDLRLLRAGLTLRRRTGGEDAGWHLKLPVSGQTREEVRLTLDAKPTPDEGPTPDEVPRELADLVRARSRAAELMPVATVSTRRQTVNLLDAGGQVLAEVADDRVVAERPQGRGAADSWREVEVELAGGDRDLLVAIDAVLRRHGLHPSGRSAKLERVLASDLPTAPPSAQPTATGPAYQAVARYLAVQAEDLAALDPLVRRFRPDSVHKMRIATRRLRGALRSFGSVISPSQTEHIAAELKWLGDTLGQARDAEILARHLRARQEETDTSELLGPVVARIESHFARASAEARAAVLSALRSARYTELLEGLDALIAEPPLGPAGQQPAGVAMPAAVADSYRSTRRRMRRALASPPGADRDVALHQARKAAKRSRYAAEAASGVAGPDANRFAGQMKNVQTVLGDHQDIVIARQLERSLGVAAHLAGESAFSYGVFYERDACDARMLQGQLAAIWQRASRRRYRRWL
jgi:CHAD domain-containing protein